MRFVCDRCRAQYMISDDKVGPKGVKVRCKKCSHVIWVRRDETGETLAPPSEPPGAPTGEHALPPAPSDEGGEPEGSDRTQVMNAAALLATAEKLKASPTITARSQIGLGDAAPTPVRTPSLGKASSDFLGSASDDEIGAAFDSALSGSPAPSMPGDDEETVAREPPVSPSSPSHQDDDDDEDHAQTRVLDLKAVRALAQEAGVGGSMARAQARGNAAVATAPTAASESTEPAHHEWYVAINDNQVGPIDVEKVKALWKDGELGPDSLCWRVGFSDWIPLSEATELASVLAPRPAKPTIVAPAAPAGRAPVESAFSGRTITATQPAAPSPSSGGGEEKTGGWRPSAASELASLVKEEIEALSKPSRDAQAKPEARARTTTVQDQAAANTQNLMEVPSAEFPLPAAAARQEPPRTTTGEVNAFGAGFSAYRPPPPPPSTFLSRNRLALMLAGGGLVMIGLLIAIIVLLANPKTPAITVNVPSQPPPIERGASPKRAEQPAQAPPTPAATAETPPSTPRTEEVAQLPPSPPANALPPLRSVPERSERRRRDRKGNSTPSNAVSDDDEVGSFTVGPKKSTPPPDPSASDDDFEREFGGGKSGSGKRAKTPSTYVPPAPGSADIPESLSQSDIIQVVVQHKPAILKCAEEQKKVDPGTSGRLVMRWSILPSGKPTQVSAQSSEFKSTPMAACLTKLIPTWTFPRHKSQGPAIDFPFTF